MPRLLLHTCCVLCSCSVLEKLRQNFAVTAYFYNPNIEPREEYEKRRDMVKEWCDKAVIPFTEDEYDNAGWRRAVKGYEKEPEGGARCTVCFAFRLWRAAKFAKENNFDFFATTLTMGRNKRAELINPLAQKIAETWSVNPHTQSKKTSFSHQGIQAVYSSRLGDKSSLGVGVKFYAADWKKGGGQERARTLSKENNLYHQNYCGCLLTSKNDNHVVILSVTAKDPDPSVAHAPSG